MFLLLASALASTLAFPTVPALVPDLSAHHSPILLLYCFFLSLVPAPLLLLLYISVPAPALIVHQLPLLLLL